MSNIEYTQKAIEIALKFMDQTATGSKEDMIIQLLILLNQQLLNLRKDNAKEEVK